MLRMSHLQGVRINVLDISSTTGSSDLASRPPTARPGAPAGHPGARDATHNRADPDIPRDCPSNGSTGRHTGPSGFGGRTSYERDDRPLPLPADTSMAS